MSSITLSAGVRSNLLSLQGTANLLEQTQNRLATGKKVNGPLDDAAAFFTAQGLNSRANDLSSITQGMQNGMKTIDAASKGIDSISTTMETMIGQVRQALQDPGNATSRSTGFTIAEEDFTSASIIVGSGADAVTANLDTSSLDFATQTGTDAAARANAVAEVINGNSDLATAGVSAEVNDSDELVIVNDSGRELTLSDGGTAATQVFGATPANVAAVDPANMSDTRQSLMNSYNDLRTELDALARDSGYNGNNLLMGDALEVVFNELTGNDRTSFEISSKQADGTAFGNITSDRLGGVAGTANNFGSNYELESMLEGMQDGVSELRSLSSQLGTAQTIVENRESFTKEMVNTLQAGADGLTLADMNEEAANNLALQTKQQLGQSALGLAIQNDQSILQLLR